MRTSAERWRRRGLFEGAGAVLLAGGLLSRSASATGAAGVAGTAVVARNLPTTPPRPSGRPEVVGGTGRYGYAGDGGPATMADMAVPVGLAVDGEGALYVADAGNGAIRRITLDGRIETVAGSGEAGDGGDEGPAPLAQLGTPLGIAVAPDGGLYVADTDNHRVRRVGPGGTITTVAGSGRFGRSGDGGPAVQARLAFPNSVAVAPDGGLYVADTESHRVRRVWPEGTITTVAGTGEPGASGDGGPARLARLRAPAGLAVTPDGDLYIADSGNGAVRRVTPEGTIETVAGRAAGNDGDPGWDGSAYSAKRDRQPDSDGETGGSPLLHPYGLALAPGGGLYIADPRRGALLRLTPTGRLVTVAEGTALRPAWADALRPVAPHGVATRGDGSIYVTETHGNRVLRLAEA